MAYLFSKKIATFACVSILSMSLSGVATAPFAMATDSAIPSTTITNDKGSLIIHKRTQPDTPGSQATGKVTDSVGGDAVSGVQYKVQRVTNADLKTNAGWVKAQENSEKFLEGLDPAVLGTFDNEKTLTTDTNGVATFSDLPIGQYLVTETDITGAQVGGTSVKVQRAAPFLVTIPLTVDNTTWQYDVNVYPKNTTLNHILTVTDDKINIGQKITYTSKSDIPFPDLTAAGDARPLAKYEIYDSLDLVLNLDENDVTLSFEGYDSDTLVKDTDYTVSITPASGDQGQLLKVTFTPAGLQKLANARKDSAKAKVQLVTQPTVTKQPDTQEIRNIVYFSVGDDYTFNQATPASSTAIASNEVITKINKHTGLVVNKSDEVVENAKISIYRCADNSPVTIDGQKITVTSNNTTGGNLPLTGLQDSAWRNGEASTEYERNLEYCAVTDEVPEGYERLPEPVRFNSVPDGTTPKIVLVAKNAGFNLPLTGSNGLLITSIAGVLIIAGGFFLGFGRKRKKNEEEA